MNKARNSLPYVLMVVAIAASLLLGYKAAPKAAAAEKSAAYSGFEFAVSAGGDKRAISAGPGVKSFRLKNTCSTALKVLIRDAADMKDLGVGQILDPRNSIVVRGELIYIQGIDKKYASVHVIPIPEPK